MPPPKGGSRCAAEGVDHRLVVDNYVGRDHAGAPGGPIIRRKTTACYVHASVHLCEQSRVTPSPRARAAFGRKSGIRQAGVRELQQRARRHHHLVNRPAAAPLPGFKNQAAGVPVYRRASEYEGCATPWRAQAQRCFAALPAETFPALGFDFAAGSGPAHKDMCRNARARYDMALVTPLHRRYEIQLRDGTIAAHQPAKMPDPSKIEEIREPISKHHFVPQEYVGAYDLCTKSAEVQKKCQYHGRQVMLTYEMPLRRCDGFFDNFNRSPAILVDYDSRSTARRHGELDILINGERVDACRSGAQGELQYRGRDLVSGCAN